MILMPWKEQTVEKTREDFVKEVMAAETSKTKLCAKYGISRVTGDKWLERHQKGEGFSNRSRAPFRTPTKTDPIVENLVVQVRLKYPAWGARKIVRHLQNKGYTGLPSPSTVCEILKRNGLVTPEASQAARPYKRFERALPNELWQTDFKGHFPMENGMRCHPLTTLDDCSRFSLCVDAKDNERYAGVAESFCRMFEVYGLPLALLCDNGNPWGTAQTTGYTRFEVWLMQLDILPLHCRPNHPQTQGKEERFNRTLKDEVLKGMTIENLSHAQQVFDEFRDCYNNVRPHNALNLDSPAQHYYPSERRMPKVIEQWRYPKEYKTRKVRGNGYFSFDGTAYFLSEAFLGHSIALRESSLADCVNVYFRNFRIARINLDEKIYVSRKIFRCVDDKQSG